MRRESLDLYYQLVKQIRAETLETITAGLNGAYERGPARAREPARMKRDPSPKMQNASRVRLFQGRRPQSDVETLMDTLRAYIIKHPGLRAAEICKGMALTPAALRLPLRKLRAGKLITVKGKRSGMTYTVKA
jgi:hypothetical protein